MLSYPSPSPSELSRYHEFSNSGTMTTGSCLTLCDADERQETEAFIRSVYQLNFQACPPELLPYLLRTPQKQGALRFALGMKPADEGPLFLEQYLKQPVEQLIAQQTGKMLSRSMIAEIGNLAATHPGSMRSAIRSCTQWLFEQGYEWVVFTGTRPLLNCFTRLGLQPTRLAQALPECLNPKALDTWGNYFTHHPEVCFGNIRDGFAQLP